MSGLRRCECGRLFKIENGGPEAMRPDGTFPKHLCGRCKRSQDLILAAVEKLKEDDFRFTVEVSGPPWDVYYVRELGGRPALLAVRLVDGHAEIGTVGEADWDADKMIASLRQAGPN